MGNAPSSAVLQAVHNGDVQAVRIAIQEHPTQIDDTEPTHGWTPLHIASIRGYDVIVRELLARCAAPNLVDKEGRTPLHLAAAEGHAIVVKDLLRRGGDPLRKDEAGKLPVDLAQEQQHVITAGLLADAMAGRGVSTPTGTGSPAAWQARGQAQQDVPVAGGASVRVLVPDFANLGITPTGSGGYLQGSAGSADAAAGGAYPNVPAPLPGTAAAAAAGAGYDSSWLSQLPVPPGVSISAPSAPPAPAGAGQQQQQMPPGAPAVSALPDYYSYIRPLPAEAQQQAAAGQPAAAGGYGGGAYPTLPGATAPPAAYSSQPQQQQWPQQQWPQQQQQQQQQQGWPPAGMAPPAPAVQQQWQQPQQLQPHQQQPGSQQPAVPAAPAEGIVADDDDDDDDDDGGWGAAADDDWGGGADRPSVSTIAAAPGAVSAGRPGKPGGPDLNAAVGAAVTGASKVVGAVGKTAVAGAKQFLGGLIPKPPGKGGRDSPGPELAADMPGATFGGPAGRIYSYDELARATQGFHAANRLGSGGYGPVYRGMLDGVPVAVKLLDTSGCSSQGPKEFAAEVAILSRLHHPHIVLLMGSCPERCGLVYELLDNGSLEQHLFSSSMPDLAWQDRIRIACETVSALVFLHSAPEPIIHMDLKPGNLLLNRSLLCKVGDVGLSRLMPGVPGRTQLEGGGAAAAAAAGGRHLPPQSTMLDSRLVGTPSYMDPEYLRTGRFGPKSDTYSLGIILLQMLTGKDAGRVVATVEAALARCQGDPASFATIIDPRSGNWPITEAASFAHLAMRCVELSRSNRPDLRAEVLPALLQLAERASLYDSARAVKRSVSLSSSGQPPSMFICPITQDVMDDPVFAADGYTYERKAIAGWIAHHSTSPMTNLPLAHTGLTANLGLRSAIREWQDKQGGRRA